MTHSETHATTTASSLEHHGKSDLLALRKGILFAFDQALGAGNNGDPGFFGKFASNMFYAKGYSTSEIMYKVGIFVNAASYLR